MVKLKKYQRVEIYLNKLLRRDDFGFKELEGLKYKDVNGAKELEGIGDRTISNILYDFKMRRGIIPPEEKTTKGKKVENYLISKIESGELLIKDLLNMKYSDLKSIKELADVGKTTATCTLSLIKQQYDTKSFENSVLDFLALEKSSPVKKQSPPAKPKRASAQPNMSQVMAQVSQNSVVHFEPDEIGCIREMIAQYSQGTSFELLELKKALQFAGINYHQLIKRYKEKNTGQLKNRNFMPDKTRDLLINRSMM